MSPTVQVSGSWYYRGVTSANLYGPYLLEADARAAHAQLEAAVKLAKPGVDGQLQAIVSKFGKNAVLVHVKSGSRYKVLETPAKARLEDTGEPAYFYEAEVDGSLWARSQRYMEDGRFELAANQPPTVQPEVVWQHEAIVHCELGEYRLTKDTTDLSLEFSKGHWTLNAYTTATGWAPISGSDAKEPFVLVVDNKLIAANAEAQVALKEYLAEQSLIEHAEWNSQMNMAWHAGRDDGKTHNRKVSVEMLEAYIAATDKKAEEMRKAGNLQDQPYTETRVAIISDGLQAVMDILALSENEDYQLSLQNRLNEAHELLNAPELHDFSRGVVLEAAHQRQKWGAEHDAGKHPTDWLFLLGFLGGKACQAVLAGNKEKALHHCISSAAMLANWHALILSDDMQAFSMRPGILPPAELSEQAPATDPELKGTK